MSGGEAGFWTGSISYAPVYAPGGLNISIGTGPDANGISWIWQEIKGWDSPDVAGQVVQRSGDHGGYPAPQFYAARIITVTIMATAPTQALRDYARSLFQQIIPVGITPGDLAMLVYNEPVPKQAQIRRSGKIPEQYPSLTDAIFTANLVAPDPRKYSTTRNTVTAYMAGGAGGGSMVVPFTVPFSLAPGLPPGTATCVNGGTFETRPQVLIRGPVNGPVITNVTYNRSVSFSQVSLGAGDSLLVDLDAMCGFFDGGAYRTADLSSAWWTLWPGVNVIDVGGVSVGSGASFTVSWNNGYV